MKGVQIFEGWERRPNVEVYCRIHVDYRLCLRSMRIDRRKFYTRLNSDCWNCAYLDSTVGVVFVDVYIHRYVFFIKLDTPRYYDLLQLCIPQIVSLARK